MSPGTCHDLGRVGVTEATAALLLVTLRRYGGNLHYGDYLPETWDAVLKVAAEAGALPFSPSPVRCSQCLRPEATPHKESCHRQGPVSIASDFRFEGRSMQKIQELSADNSRLQAENAALRAQLAERSAAQ